MRDDDPLGVIGASYLALNAIWVITWLPLTWAFRVVAPGRPDWRAALIGGVVTGAFISGFLQGFTLFLALPVDLGRPFGGLTVVGATSALLLWLWVLHVVVCIGYAFTWAVDAAFASKSPSGLAGS
jgi:membrane protein